MSLLTDAGEIHALADRIKAAGPDAVVAWDTETNAAEGTGFKKPELALFGGAWVAGISVSLVTAQDAHEGRVEGFYVPVAHRAGNAPVEAVRALQEALSGTQALVAEANGLFDRWGLSQTGPVPSWRSVDVQVASWLDDENRKKGLKYLGSVLVNEDADAEANYLKEIRKAPYGKLPDARKAVIAAYPELAKVLKSGKLSVSTPNEEGERLAQSLRRGRSWSDLTVGEIAEYAARDATLTYEVAHALLGGHDRILSPSGPLQREMELQPILYGMTKRGIGVYTERFDAAAELYRARANSIAAEVDAQFGDRYRMTHGRKEQFNIGSNPAVEWLLFDHLGLESIVSTDGGGRSVSKEALSVLQGEPIVKTILEYRRWDHAVGSYAEPFGNFARHSSDERIHGHFSSVGTVTGRLAASNPNVMTIPKDNTLPEIRQAMYRVDPGYERLGFDLASAELWVTASITRDKVLTDALLEGRSLHLETMKAVWGFEDKESPLYTIAKNVNYSMAYEAGVGPITIYAAAAGYDFKTARSMAYKIMEGHKRLYRGMHYMSEYLADKAMELGKLPLHVEGRYRHFRSPGAIVNYYTALNAMVQGGIGEYMKDVMLEVHRRGYGELLILQVHDELVFDAPIGMKEELLTLLRDIADDINPFRFVIPWDGKVWGDE